MPATFQAHRHRTSQRTRPHQPFRPLLAAVLLFTFAMTGATAKPAQVLVLHSYHQGFPWTDRLQAGIEEGLSGAATPPEVAVEYMDAKRHDRSVLQGSLSALYAAKYRDAPPDIIISCDDDAFAFLLEHRERLFPNVPVVFGGLDVEDYEPTTLAGHRGYTGVVERLDLTSTLETILALQPEVERILFIHDRTVSGLAHRRAVQSLEPRYRDRVAFDYADPGTGLSEVALLGRLALLEADTAVYFLGFFRNRDGEPLEAGHIIPRISATSPVPVYSHAKAYLGYGILGGKLLSADVHGRSLARKALEVLDGRPADQSPVSVESSNAFLFDHRQLTRFAIPEARLPAGSLVLYGPESFLDRHRNAIRWGTAGVLLLLALVAVLSASLLHSHRIERRLAERERQYRLLVENQTDVIIQVDRRGRFQFVSPSFCRTVDMTEEELIGHSLTAFVHPSDLPRVMSRLKGLAQAPHQARAELRARTLNGWRWFCWSANPVFDARGRVAAVIAHGHDVTERREAQEALSQSEAKYRAMFEDNRAIKLLLDVSDGRIVQANSAAVRFYGYPAEILEGLRISQINELSDAEVQQRMELVQQQGYGQFEFRHRLATGEVRDVVVDASPMTWGERRLLYSIVHDITEKKRTEKALRESEALLRTTEAIAHIGGWEWNLVSQRGSWTEETRRILNQPASNEQGLRARDLVRALKRFDPNTQNSLQALVRRCMHEGKAWDITVPLPVPADNERWARVIGQGQLEDGRLVRMVGNVMDVTEQVRAQARIRHFANHDALTGLPSLRLARDRLRMAIEGARRESRLAALLFVDLDGFKAVNDGYGHEAGDRVLKDVAARLERSVRQTDTVARIGGDEFLMILPGLKTASEAEQLGDKAIAALSEPVAWGETSLHVGASIGIALYPRDGVDGRQLLRLADQAMYRVKRTTKNGYSFVEEPSPG